jgi:pimeloyl-ACP methyl ester carboxylesterase
MKPMMYHYVRPQAAGLPFFPYLAMVLWTANILGYFAARLKRARRVVVSGGSHAFAEERAEEVAAAIEQHLSPEC